MKRFVTRTLRSGLLSGTAAALAASIAARHETGSYPSALNATSHILWGDEAARYSGLSAKYTGTGALLHYGASGFWAALYEALPGRPVWRAPGIAALAYVIDYHVVPRRLTPGFEKRISGRALCGVYLALALGLLLASSSAARG